MLIVSESRRLLKRFKDPGGKFIFLTNSPFCDYLVDRLHPAAVVYDIIDDFVSFEWAPPDGASREGNLLRRAGLIFTGTGTLLEKKTRGHPNSHFIPCGVDFERFARGASEPEPPELSTLPRPILGYMGTLSDRLDRDLIGALARRFPKASVVLIGPVHGSFGPLVREPNIHYLGLKPPEQLPAYAARFDAALMPFAQTEAARAINPVKTLEYLAAGCRVISTPIPDLERFFSDVVDIAPGVEPFLDRVAAVLERKDAARVEKGIERARTRSWQSMSDEMEDRLKELIKSITDEGIDKANHG